MVGPLDCAGSRPLLVGGTVEISRISSCGNGGCLKLKGERILIAGLGTVSQVIGFKLIRFAATAHRGASFIKFSLD